MFTRPGRHDLNAMTAITKTSAGHLCFWSLLLLAQVIVLVLSPGQTHGPWGVFNGGIASGHEGCFDTKKVMIQRLDDLGIQ